MKCLCVALVLSVSACATTPASTPVVSGAETVAVVRLELSLDATGSVTAAKVLSSTNHEWDQRSLEQAFKLKFAAPPTGPMKIHYRLQHMLE